jgi:hypothetical protein
MRQKVLSWRDSQRLGWTLSLAMQPDEALNIYDELLIVKCKQRTKSQATAIYDGSFHSCSCLP